MSYSDAIKADLLCCILKCGFLPTRIIFILFVCCVGIDIYESEHAEWQRSTVSWVSSQGEGVHLCLYPKPVIFHSCRFSPQWQAFYFLHDRGSAKVWNIYEGVRDGAPFQDLPLWLRIRAFSSALNNSCRESICLVRFFFFYLMRGMDRKQSALVLE